MNTIATTKKFFAVAVCLSMLLVSSGAFSGARAARSQDSIPSSILDPDEVSWASMRGLTSSQFSDDFKTRSNNGYMLIDIEVNEIDGVERVGGVWQKNLDSRDWAELRNMTETSFIAENVSKRSAGFRMIDQEVYLLGGRPLYAAIWIKNAENLDWISYTDQDSAQFGVLFDRYSQAGYLMIDLDAYLNADGNLRYSAVWVDNSENLDWIEWRDLTSAEFNVKFDLYRASYRMIDIESYRVSGQQYFAGIWVKNVNGRDWAMYRGLTSKQFGDKWLQLRDAGYRLIDYEAYDIGGEYHYAGTWRQNGDRLDWALKIPVDSYLEFYNLIYSVPGMSVAVIQDGKFVYLHGQGFADIDDEIIAHSRTIFRLASVSKAVGGTLAMRLTEQGLLDVNQPTLSYIPSLPAFHTHTLAQTLSNRAGIGHYDEYPSIVGSYATAFAAVQNLENTPLLSAPGAEYHYSTHAYTFAGAAMEAAVGDPIQDIVFNVLTQPFNLNTLRLEDRSVPNKFRATLYNTENEEVTPDDLSWKVLGGGLEASAYDLARFGIKTINAQVVVSETLRDEMWSDKSPAAKYGYGWLLGTEDGYQVVAKDGANNGAQSYIRLYPELGTVIAVLTNRKEGGHDTRAVAKHIGELILGQIPKTSSMSFAPQYIPVLGQEDLIEEPGEETQDPAQIILPIVLPQADPSPEDLQEPPSIPIDQTLIFLPLISGT